jgi:hypothetical protein
MMHCWELTVICLTSVTAYLYGEYDDSAVADHVQKERHGFVLVWRVRIEGTLLWPDTPTRLVQYNHVDPSSLVFLSSFQDLASYTNITFLSSGIALVIAVISLTCSRPHEIN